MFHLTGTALHNNWKADTTLAGWKEPALPMTWPKTELNMALGQAWKTEETEVATTSFSLFSSASPLVCEFSEYDSNFFLD